jgi:hypothetical protein
MDSAQHGHGIVNGHWEPSPHELPKVVVAIRSGVAKLLQKISDHGPKATQVSANDQHHDPVAAE